MFTKKNVKNAQKIVLEKFPQFAGFQLLRLKEFLKLYSYEYDMDLKKKNKVSPYEIICLVDTREDVHHTMSNIRRKNLQKVCGAKRRRIKNKYHYENVFNRIHGYLSLEDMKHIDQPKGKKVFSLSLLCTSFYSNMKGVGTLLMETMIELGKNSKYTDIILEVANEHAGPESGEESSEESSEEESSDEEEETYPDSDEEELYLSEEESDEEEYINEELISRLGNEFYRKVMRLRDNTAYYNIDEDYIADIIESYIDDVYDIDSNEEDHKIIDLNEPGENDYGGYYYHKGKISQIGLFRFYEKFGFKEDGRIHYEWKAFSTYPFPTMILNL